MQLFLSWTEVTDIGMETHLQQPSYKKESIESVTIPETIDITTYSTILWFGGVFLFYFLLNRIIAWGI